VRVLLIDFDASAMDEARKRVAAAGLEDRFSFRIDTTKAVEGAGREFAPHIVEMIGFLDYRPRNKAIALIDRIRRQLPDEGIFLTCNIHHNREKIFLDWVLLWPMIYRTDAEFAELMVEGGFAADRVRLIYEPFRIHGIAVCRK
jgi:cyclopropane fatty-acyl-phospholipid synthase-like methyltransferase